MVLLFTGNINRVKDCRLQLVGSMPCRLHGLCSNGWLAGGLLILTSQAHYDLIVILDFITHLKAWFLDGYINKKTILILFRHRVQIK
jgi:hypothetical protein